MTATIASIHAPTVADDDSKIRDIIRRDSALRAIYRVRLELELDWKRAKADWKKQINEQLEAIQAHLDDDTRAEIDLDEVLSYAEIDDDDRAALCQVIEHYDAACRATARVKKLRGSEKADNDERSSRVAKFTAAEHELMAWRDSAQTDLFATDAVTWASQVTVSIAFTALQHLDKIRGLDPFQGALLVELGSADFDPMDLGIKAEEAVEQDVDEDEFEDDEDFGDVDIDSVLD